MVTTGGTEGQVILVVSSPADDHARRVIDALRARDVPVGLLDLSDVPQRLHLSMDLDGTTPPEFRLLDGETNELRLADCTAVWWRRPQRYGIHPGLRDPTDVDFAFRECHAAMSGLWSSLDAFWVNEPDRDEAAHRKVYQLKVAREVGFSIPETRVTNDPQRALEFVDRFGPESTVYKPFTATVGAWRETRTIRPGELSLVDGVRFAPVIFQEYVPARVDLRITVMGEAVLAAAIHSQETAYAVDYRMDMDRARVESAELPEDVVETIHAYVDRMGLQYGAIDMRLTPEGEYVFLEINPSGQWLFVEERTDLPLTETFVELLASAGE